MRLYIETKQVIEVPDALEEALRTGKAEAFSVLEDALLHNDVRPVWLAIDCIEPTSQTETPDVANGLDSQGLSKSGIPERSDPLWKSFRNYAAYLVWTERMEAMRHRALEEASAEVGEWFHADLGIRPAIVVLTKEKR